MVGERVFLRDFGVEDGFELRPFARKFRELEMAAVAEAKAQFDTSSGCATFSPVEAEKGIAVLRHDALRVNHAVVNVVFQVVGERVVRPGEGLARYSGASSLSVAADVSRL